MLDRLLPPRIDNAYRGRTLALWLFGLVVALKMLQSVVVLANGSSIARSADGIRLLAVDYLARRLILYFIPIATAGTPPGPMVNLVIFALMVIGLALSLWSSATSRRASLA